MAGEVAVDSLAAKLNTLVDEKLRDKVNTFLNELENSRTILKDGDKKAKHDLHLDSEFIRKLRFIYDAEDMCDRFIPEISRRRKGKFSAWKQYYDLSTAAAKILSRYKVKHNPNPLPKNDDSGNNSHSDASTNSEGADRWERIAALAEDSAKIIGLEDQKEDLRNLILEKRRSSPVIAVIGEAGIGKTTLARFVFESVEIKKQFECCAWITVSDKYETRDILISIMRQVSVVREEQKLQPEELQSRVHNYLKSRTFLIVLDDVQSVKVWVDLRDAFPNTVHTSRVILTMRKIEDARTLGLRSQRSLASQVQLFQIRRLNPEEMWSLFKKAALQADAKTNQAREEKLEQSREELKLKIVSKCDGLPLAIVTLSGLLSAKPVDQWSSWMEENVDDKLSKQGDLLFLSYQELHPSLRPLLLYLGIFPKSYEIPIRRLFRLWLAEGLATQKAGGTEAEDLLEKNFEQLVQRNLIVVAKRKFGSPKSCMAQPALHDSVFRAAANTGFFHIQRSDQGQQEDNAAQRSDQGKQQPSDQGKQENNVVQPNGQGKPQETVVRRRLVQQLNTSSNPKDDGFQYEHLRSYISFNSHKGDAPANEVDELLKHITTVRSFTLLTVLDLEHVYKPVLKEVLGKLQQLKYLGLRWTFLDSIPKEVGKLACLETLDVKHTNIPFLPNSIWKAKRLRYLYMNEVHFHISKKKFDIRLLSSNLDTLWGLLVGKNGSDMLIWLKQLTDLRKLGITCFDSSLKDIIGWISGLENLQSLRLRSINKYNEPSYLNLPSLKCHSKLQELHLFGNLRDGFNSLGRLENLRVLTLSVSQRDEDPMLVLGNLTRLNILRLFARSYIGTQMKCIRGGFLKLRVLKLWVLENLEEWIVEEGSMVELRELEIRCCEKLQWPAGLQHLSNSLKELNLTNMPDKFVEDARANLRDKVLLVINPKKLEIPPLPSRT